MSRRLVIEGQLERADFVAEAGARVSTCPHR